MRRDGGGDRRVRRGGDGGGARGAGGGGPPASGVVGGVVLPGGGGWVGCAVGDARCFEDEKPGREVTLSAFAIDAVEVTVDRFAGFVAATGQVPPPPPPFRQGGDEPVVNVTWSEAEAYCRWVGKRLPTEAEWEVAARAGGTFRFPGADLVTHETANYEGTGGRDRFPYTAPVGSFPATGNGLFDMAGNVWEWVADWLGPTPPGPEADPRGPATGKFKVVKGGGWNSGVVSLRVSNRGRFSPETRNPALGFRCAASLAALPSPEPAAEPSAPPAAPPAPAATPEIAPPAATATGAPVADVAPGEPAVVAATPPMPQPGERRVFPPAADEMVWVPPGSFEMGCVVGDGQCSADEQPRHLVRLTRGVWAGVSEVTVASYRRYAEAVGATFPRLPPWVEDDHPMVEVTWHDADGYCRWAGGRLPTEAEWEYLARGGTGGSRYPGGATITRDEANFDGTGGRDVWPKSSPVGSFPANPFGLVDLLGNAWEWCADLYDESYYAVSPEVDPPGPPTGSTRVVRGGSWTSDPGRLRLSYRYSQNPANSMVSLGFRCVRDP